VQHGAFAGLLYPRNAVGNVACLPAKLLGSYERELSEILAGVSAYDLFVDLGSGDGLYCVGVKRQFPTICVIGYEMDRAQRRIAKSLAASNKVQFASRGAVDTRELNKLPAGRLFLMSDVEGLERDLLDPVLVPRLIDAAMLIEVHPTVHADIVDVLTARFEATHEVRVIVGAPKRPGDHSELADWNPNLARYAVSEGRSVAPLWLHLQPTLPPDGSASDIAAA